MPEARYYVFKQEREWLVVFEGRVMARHTAKQKALQNAIGMANLMGAMHYDADVMLDDGKAPLQQVWARAAGAPSGAAAERRKAPRRTSPVNKPPEEPRDSAG